MRTVRVGSVARLLMEAWGGGKASYSTTGAETMAVSKVLAHAGQRAHRPAMTWRTGPDPGSTSGYDCVGWYMSR